MKRHRAVITLLAIAVALALTATSAQGQKGRLIRKGHKAIPNRYIVVLRDDGSIAAGDHAAVLGRMSTVSRGRSAVADRVYSSAVRGFSAFMSDVDAVAISSDPLVSYVEEDALMEVTATQTAPPSWGLDRIGQRQLPLNGVYSYTSTGAGVRAYVIDTGIRQTHTQFGGRARPGVDAVDDGLGTSDCHGHGTHVAGTIGGSAFGVAKKVILYSVRVLGCSGSGLTSAVIAGVDWVTSRSFRPAVANMSLTGPTSSALDAAVRNSIASGVTFTLAAGNDSVNAINVSPARVTEAITVGSSTRSDRQSSFSNYGSVVDLFAPGSSITSSWYTSDTATATLSGTSMAAPHVAGVAARYLQAHQSASPTTVRNAIVGVATLYHLTALHSGTANRLLFWSSAQ